MRYVAIAFAALGALRLSGASPICDLDDSDDSNTNTNKIRNGDFSNGLEGFNTSGTVKFHATVPGHRAGACDGYRGVVELKATEKIPEGESGDDIQERATLLTTSGVSGRAKKLEVGTKYAVEFFYNVQYSPKANICRIQVYFDSVNIGNTTYFPATFLGGNTWTEFNTTVKATSTTGTLKLLVACTSLTAQIYIDDVSVRKAVASTSSTIVTTSSITSVAYKAEAATTTSTPSPTTITSPTSTTTSATSSAQGTTSSAAGFISIAASTSTKSQSAITSAAPTSSSSAAATTSSHAGSIQAAGKVASGGSGTSSSSTLSPTSSASLQARKIVSSLAAAAGALTTSPTTVTSASTSSTSTATKSSSSIIGAHGSGATVDATILLIAADADTASQGSLGLLSYGIPYEVYIMSGQGVSALPKLNSSSTQGNYGGIIVMSSVAYESISGWSSALTDDEWNQLFAYQSDFNVRMVRINEYPGTKFGTTTVNGGCCISGQDQTVAFTDTSDFPTANLKKNAEVSTAGIWHVPASITDSSTTKQVAKFGITTGFAAETVAAVINNFNGREQFVWFMGWAPTWSLTSNYLQHAHIHWMTRGVFLGKRKVHLSCQIDDVQLATELYYPTGLDDFKIQIADLEAHVTWQNNLATRLPAGSDFWLEFAHNGNGDFIGGTPLDTNSICDPDSAIYYDSANATALEFQKVLGTGEDQWPPEYEVYQWSKACAKLDDFASWFLMSDNLNQFAHLSHTFTHLSLNNATYHDVSREIKFNQDWMAQMGIDQATRFSPHGLVPPAITGMHNGDAIQAWMDNGIIYVVGDNTRPVLRNSNNPYWPLISTVANNGYDGLTIIPRFSTAIYFNCNTMDCTTKEWIATSAGKGDYFSLLAASKASTIRNLLALQSDPYMFHQANMHTTTVSSITIGSQSGKMSLVTSWTETMIQEMMRLTNWPIKSLKHDDIAQYFLDRASLDGCKPKLSYSWNSDGTSIKSVTVTANKNTCPVPIPVTIPLGAATASGGSVTADVLGSEPPIQWVTLAGSPVTLSLSSPVPA